MFKTVSNEEAFRKLPDEKNIPINYEKHAFEFTRQWFRNRNQTTWSTFLPPRFQGQAVNMIQIGVFEGMDLVWCAQNLLNSHRESRAIGIDPWQQTTKLSKKAMADVAARATNNLAPYSKKVTLVRGKSLDELKKLKSDSYDLIVIDGDHNRLPVFQDAEQALRLLKRGGWMVFDDVRNRVPKPDHVVDGLRDFIEKYGSKVKLEWQHRYADCYSKL